MNMHRSNLLLLSGIVCFLVSTDKCLAEVTIETPAEDAQIIVGPNDTTFDIEIEFKSETGDGRFRASIVFEGPDTTFYSGTGPISYDPLTMTHSVEAKNVPIRSGPGDYYVLIEYNDFSGMDRQKTREFNVLIDPNP